jgi:hypothetical protein
MSKIQASEKKIVPQQQRRVDTQINWKAILLGTVPVTVASFFGFLTLNPPEWHLCFVHLRGVWDRILQTRLHSIWLAALCFSAGCSAPLSNVDAYLEKQIPLSKARLLANIGPDGINSSGAKVCVRTF